VARCGCRRLLQSGVTEPELFPPPLNFGQGSGTGGTGTLPSSRSVGKTPGTVSPSHTAYGGPTINTMYYDFPTTQQTYYHIPPDPYPCPPYYLPSDVRIGPAAGSEQNYATPETAQDSHVSG